MMQMNLITLSASPGLSLRPLPGEGTLKPHNLITLKPITLQIVLLSAWDSDVISMRF
jgi:hypothetical protein